MKPESEKKMPPAEIPPEQALCRSCGFCCDGTLFAWAPLKAGEKDLAGGEEPRS